MNRIGDGAHPMPALVFRSWDANGTGQQEVFRCSRTTGPLALRLRNRLCLTTSDSSVLSSILIKARDFRVCGVSPVIGAPLIVFNRVGQGSFSRPLRNERLAPGADTWPYEATDPHASVVIIAADRVVTKEVTGQKNHAYVQRSGLSVSIIPLTGCDRAIADMSRRLKSP